MDELRECKKELLERLNLEKSDPSVVIATIDKDLDTCPGWHYNWNKGTFYFVEGEDADYFFYKQLLTGDTVDNIPGLPGIGPKKAEKILSGAVTEFDMYWKCVCAYENSAYERPMDALIENARLLWIHREIGQLWQPPE